MNNHFVKFALLIAVIGAVLFSHTAYPTANTDSRRTTSTDAAAQINSTPLFVLPPVAVSPTTGNGSTATNAGTPPARIQPPAPSGTSGGSSKIPPLLQLSASIVFDMKTGVTAESLNANRRWPTASLAKLMSATVALDKLGQTTQVTITEEMFSADPTEQTLFVGGRYSVADLLKLMLLPSSNVAAEAIASFYGRTAFIAEMNTRADAWGMTNTHYDDPSGISAGDQSTANDLVKLAQKISATYPQIWDISRTPQVNITELGLGNDVLIKSINDFAGDAGFVGGKTGHTTEAGDNLLSVFRYNGGDVLVVVLGSADRFRDTKALYNWFKLNFE